MVCLCKVHFYWAVMQPDGLSTCVLLMVKYLCSLSAQWPMSLYKSMHADVDINYRLQFRTLVIYMYEGQNTNQAGKFNVFCISKTFVI